MRYSLILLRRESIYPQLSPNFSIAICVVEYEGLVYADDEDILQGMKEAEESVSEIPRV